MTTLVIGIGNRDRGDDGFGPAVVEALQRLGLLDVDTASVAEDLVAHFDRWPDYEQVVLVDAVQSGHAPGTVHRFDATAAPLPATFGKAVSTHAVGVSTAIELARQLGRMPKLLMVIGVEAAHLDVGQGLSPETRRALGAVVDEIRAR